ncbi:unnamed protein product [Linum trigynum]|uniref:Uncharacterized protein n=1 Tax=Linum trigynum TaxID=586398 RepID=A0AAV2EK30_9ROSI
MGLVYYCFMVLFMFQIPNRVQGIQRNYIVYLGSHSHDGSGRTATTTAQSSQPDDSYSVQAITESHHNLLGSFLGSEKAREAIGYSYTWNINGFTAKLDEAEAAEIAKHPDVVSVFLDRGRKLHTTRSWDYLSLEKNGAGHPGPLWKAAKFGEGTIIATLDTGVWPESKSFDDEGYGPVPSKWKGICQNNTKAGVPCNKKLVGARFFSKGYIQAGGNPTNQSFLSARDSEGHGTHTLSTAGGNFVPQAKILGAVKGTAKGGAPRARVAAYKVCWPPVNESECFDSDILAAFDAAIHDGVDVISVSLGGSADEYFQDAVAIGSFHAVKKGILVSCSAGNSGPLPGTVSNLAPWITTVAASTLDRKFVASVQLDNGLILKGESLSGPLPQNKTYPLLSAAQARAAHATVKDALLCKPKTLDPKKAKGKILACLRGDIGRVEKGKIAAMAGAVGMILCNDKINGDGDLTADPHFLPATQIGYKDGVALFRYINSTKHPKAYITPSTSMVNVKPAPVMADFSSKGPNTITPYVLKPDITAPGVNIIAAYTEAKPTDPSEDPRKFPYNILSGTSMSCPHVSGVFGLLRAVYPHWSPSAIRSAIMTTARTRDNARNPILDSTLEKATPFSYGSGHIRPNRAMDPGLVYDLTISDYLDFLCARGYNKTLLKLFSDAPHECPKHARIMDLNYPSIAVPKLKGGSSITMTRKVKNVGKSPARYAVRIKEPKGVSVSVKPNVLRFNKLGEEKKFKVILKAKWNGTADDYVFGGITWTDGIHYVRSPIAVYVVAA